MTFTASGHSPAPALAEDVPALDGSVAPRFETTTRTKRWSAAGALGFCAGALAYVYRVDPNVAGSPYPGCLFKSLTGLDCPGCGGTRAMHALLHGDLAGAADHYALIFVVAPVLLYLVVRFALQQLGVSLPAPTPRRWMAWAVVGVFLAFTVVRNLPIAPLHYLQSGLA